MISGVDFSWVGNALLAENREQSITYAQLGQWVAADRALLSGVERPALAFMFGPSGPSAVAAYLACLAEGIPIGLGEPSPHLRARVISAYRPSLLLLSRSDALPEGYSVAGGLAGGDWVLCRSESGAYELAPHPDLALLLATSGSTGDSKFVRLSLANLASNAASIAQYLGIGPGEVAVQSLPLHYSYGLSVLNSHLVAGGAVAMTGHSFMRPEFWRFAGERGCTSFAGVPYMYETLHRLRMSPLATPSVRTLTQAGGRLRVDIAREVHEAAARRNARLFLMYGQTEATARMSFVPPSLLPAKADSIGVPIPGGSLWLEAAETDPSLTELHYSGANVMLGYASAPADLALGDEMGGELSTGDLAEQDSDGVFRITGRIARFAKLFGRRIDLAGVEAEVERVFFVRAAAIDAGDHLKVFLEGGDGREDSAIRSYLADLLGVPPAAVRVDRVLQLPLTASGKKDYKALV
jgi:acyl-CoA synthetase (AMP-forming)/AMP-acid ligase II